MHSNDCRSDASLLSGSGTGPMLRFYEKCVCAKSLGCSDSRALQSHSAIQGDSSAHGTHTIAMTGSRVSRSLA
jgi:hypothetical protein